MLSNKKVMNRSRAIAFFEVICAVVFWGGSFIATKIALREVAPVTIVWLRFAMGVVILGVAVLARKQLSWPPTLELAYFAVLGFIGITFHQWLQSNALETSQATTTAWIVATTPVFIALLSWLFLKEQLNLVRIGGIALAAIGVLLVVTKGDLRAIELGKFGAPGDILVLVSAVNWAVFTVLSRRGLQLHSATLMMFYVMLFGFLFTSALFFAGPTFTTAGQSLFAAPGLADIGHLTTDGWLGVAFLGIFCSGFAYIFWYDALKIIPASQLGVFLYIEPLITMVVAALIIQESLVLAGILGGAIILLGVWLVNRPAIQSEPRLATAPSEELP